MLAAEAKEYIELGLKMLGVVALIAALVWGILKTGWKYYKEKDKELKKTKKALEDLEGDIERKEMAELRENFESIRHSLKTFKRQSVNAFRKLNDLAEKTNEKTAKTEQAVEVFVFNSNSKFGQIGESLDDINKRIDNIEDISTVLVKEVAKARNITIKKPEEGKRERISDELFILKGDKKKE